MASLRRIASLLRPAFVLALTALLTHGHGELDERIAALDARIERAPRDATLVLERAELHRLHRAWAATFRDLERCASLDAGLDGLALARARLFHDMEWYDSALRELGRHRGTEGDEVRELRAGVLDGLARERDGKHDGLARARDAARAWERFFEAAERPEPDHVVRWSAALVRRDGGDVDAALAALEQGMQRLGRVVALELAALALEERSGRIEAACARIDAARARAPRSSVWLVRKGELLARAGSAAPARAVLRSALDELEGRATRRDSALRRELAERAHRALAALE